MLSKTRNETRKEKRERQLDELKKLTVLETDPNPTQKGVLLSDQIKFYANKYDLIKPFDPNRLKPAGYELTVGDEWYLGGKHYLFQSDDPKSNKIEIEPFDVAVIKTGETICLPRFMIARWNLRVRFAYEGLLWLGGPQVDPGFKGRLFCPIYNLSDKNVTLYVGEEIALMDFVKTTDFVDDKTCVTYNDPPKRVIIEDYGVEDLESALFTKAGRRIDEFDNSLKTIEGRFYTFTSITFAILALIISIIVGIFRAPKLADIIVNPIYWVSAFTFFASFSVLLAIFRYVGTRHLEKPGPWWSALLAAIGIASLVTVGVVYVIPQDALSRFEKRFDEKMNVLDPKAMENIKNLDAHFDAIGQLRKDLDALNREVEGFKSRSKNDATTTK